MQRMSQTTIFGGGKRMAVAIALAASTLTGCGLTATITANDGAERRIGGTKASAAAKGTSAAAKPLQAGPGSSFKAPALTATHAPGAAAAGQAPAAKGAGPGSVLVGAASAPGTSPEVAGADVTGLRLVTRPDRTVRAITVHDGHDQLVDAHFEPEAGFTDWEIQAPAAGVKIAKIKYTFQGAGEAITAEVLPAQVEVPAELRGKAVVKIPFGIVTAVDAIAASAEEADVRATVTFLDAAGQPLEGADGEPFVLTTTISVL